MADAPHTFVKVTAETLNAKAEEITGKWPTVPQSPIPPCMLHVAGQGAEIIRASRDRLEGVIKAGEAEAKRLAECLRAAATAYQTVDDHRKAALDRTMGGGGTAPAQSAESVSVNPNLPPSAPAPIGQNPAKPDSGEHEDWAKAVDLIAATDQGASLRVFAEGLDKLAGELKEHATKFSMGNVSWEGAAAEAAEGALRRHESWIYEVVAKAEALAKETRKLDDVHLAERGVHPDEAAKTFFFNQPLDWQVANYEDYQNRSSDSQTRYANGASLLDVYAPAPPDGGYPATPVKAGDVAESRPQTPGSPGGPNGGGPGEGSPGAGSGGQPPAGQPTNEPSVSPASAKPAEGEPKSGSPSGEGGGSPSSGGGSPAGGGAPSGPGSGSPSGPGDTPGLPSLDDPSLAPASSGGSPGGGSPGGGGSPSSPLGPATAAETVAPSPTTRGPSGPAAPAGASGGVGGMGGGMGGMGGGHGQGQGGKEKRRDAKLAPDEELYVEDRAYTEGVIGLQSRRKRNPQEGNGDK